MLKKLNQKDLVITPKIWGTERLVVNTESYCGKILKVVPGFQSSIHYHKLKTETFLQQEGLLELELWELPFEEGPCSIGRYKRILHANSPSELSNFKRVILYPGDSITLPPFTPHRFSCACPHETAIFYEFSSHDAPEDSYRIEPSGPKVGGGPSGRK